MFVNEVSEQRRAYLDMVREATGDMISSPGIVIRRPARPSKPAFTVQINNLSSICCKIYDGGKPSEEAVRMMVQLQNSDINEAVQYVNMTGMDVTVVNRTNIPQHIERVLVDDAHDNFGQFIVRKFVILRTEKAVSKVRDYVARLDADQGTSEDIAIRASFRKQVMSRGVNVMVIEYHYTSEDIVNGEVSFDPLLDIAIGVGDRPANEMINHPRHNLNDVAKMETVLGEFNRHGEKINIEYYSNKTEPMYVRLFGQVLKLTPKTGLPVVVSGKKTTEATNEYVVVTTPNEGGDKKSFYGMEEAQERLGIFDSITQANRWGNYDESDGKRYREAEATHKQELEKMTQQFKLDQMKQASDIKSQIEKEQASEKMRLMAQIHELEQRERQRDMIAKEQAHAHQREIEGLKLKQQTVSFASERSSGESKNSGESIKLAATIITAVVAVGAAIWKVFF